MLVFKKQIDNLKTNHRGIFVLTDNRFQPLSRMSVDRRAGPKAADEAIARAQTVRGSRHDKQVSFGNTNDNDHSISTSLVAFLEALYLH